LRAVGPFLLALVACQGDPPPPPTPLSSAEPPWQGALAPTPRPGDAVVATVDGTPIYASDVAAQMAAESQDARAAVDSLIDRELLAAEARRRGHLESPEVIEARRRERVRRYIEDVFGRSFDGPEDIPLAAIDRAWKHPYVRTYYDHELSHVVRYIRLPLPETPTPAQIAELGKTAADLQRRLAAAHPPDGGEFVRLAGELYGKPLPNHRQTVAKNSGLHAAFVAAAFSVSKVGEIAEPKQTPWGWDILYLEQIIPERHASFAEAEPEIRKNRFEPERAAGFVRWVDALVARAQITRDDALLDRIAVSED
jgi:PPIC-type PPIASE domain